MGSGLEGQPGTIGRKRGIGSFNPRRIERFCFSYGKVKAPESTTLVRLTIEKDAFFVGRSGGKTNGLSQIERVGKAAI